MKTKKNHFCRLRRMLINRFNIIGNVDLILQQILIDSREDQHDNIPKWKILRTKTVLKE